MIKIPLIAQQQPILHARRRRPRAHAFNEGSQASAAPDHAAILADDRLAHAHTITYLHFAKQRQPNALRLLASAHDDRHSMMKAINQVQTHRLLPKPWRDAELEAALQPAIGRYPLRDENRRLAQQVRGPTARRASTSAPARPESLAAHPPSPPHQGSPDGH